MFRLIQENSQGNTGDTWQYHKCLVISNKNLQDNEVEKFLELSLNKI